MIGNNSATGLLYQSLSRYCSDPISKLRLQYAKHRINMARRPTMLALQKITDSMSQAERESLIRPFYYAKIDERLDGSPTPKAGYGMDLVVPVLVGGSEDDPHNPPRYERRSVRDICISYTFWIDPSDGSWRNWRMTKFYPFETLQRLGVAEVIRQAGGYL